MVVEIEPLPGGGAADVGGTGDHSNGGGGGTPTAGGTRATPTGSTASTNGTVTGDMVVRMKLDSNHKL